MTVVITNYKTKVRKIKARKEVRLNKIISLKLEGKKTVLYINDKPFRQCMRLLVNIPKREIQNYDKINSIDDLTDIYKNTEYYKKNISPEEEFKGHYSNLQTWVEHEYDTQLMHRNLAFPLLKELSKQGVLKAKNRFKEEVVQRFLSGNFNVMTYLIDQKYLSDFTEEELDVLFEEYDFSQILKWELKDRYSWLGELLVMKIKRVKTYFQRNLINLIKEEDWEAFSFILNSNHKYQLNIFSKEESKIIFENFNYDSFLNYDLAQRYGTKEPEDGPRLRLGLRILYSRASLKISSAKEFLKKQIEDNISSDNVEFLSIIFGDNYLGIFSEGEIKSLLKGLRLTSTLVLESGFRVLKILRDISRYDKTIVKPYMKLGIEKWFSQGSDHWIKEILDKRFMEIFTEGEQESLIRKINFDILRNAGPYKSLELLRRMKTLIPSIYKEGFEKAFLEGDTNFIDNLLRRNYFDDFTKEELTKLFEKFDFTKIELSLFKKFLDLGVESVLHKFKEARGESSKLVDLKKEIIGKFENGDYKSLYKMFCKYEFSEGYRDERLGDLISEDFEEIFESVNKSENFNHNFEKSLQKSNLPFSIPLKVLFWNIENTEILVKEIFKEQASKIFTSGSPLNIIAFLSRPEYSKIFTEQELHNIFTFGNEHLKSAIIEALKKDSAAPLPLVILKRLIDNGDKQAEEYLITQLLQLITIGKTSVIQFLNKDGFIGYIKDLTIEMQLYLALSPNLNYREVWEHLQSPKIEEFVDEDVRKDFKRIINRLQDDESCYLNEVDQDLLKETLPHFGTDAFRALLALYSRNSLTFQLIAVECILTIYKHHKSIIKSDIKRTLTSFFNSKFIPYFKYKHLEEIGGEEEYEEILEKFNLEYHELKNT